MKSFIIKEFKHIASGAIFSQNDANGNYIGTISDVTIIQGEKDFLCNGNYRINAIIRCVDNVIFRINDKISNKLPITGFVIEQNRIRTIFYNGSQMVLLALKHYVEEPPKAVVKAMQIKHPFDSLEDKILIDFKGKEIMLSDGYKHLPGTSIKEFIKGFFNSYNGQYGTVRCDNPNIIIDGYGKRRSLGDVYMICKNYIPETTLYDVIKEMYALDGVITFCRSSYCLTILKRVWRSNNPPGHYPDNKFDEYGFKPEWYIENIKTYVKKPIALNPSLLDEAKAKFKIGIKFTSMVNGQSLTIDTKEFREEDDRIVQIGKSGRKRIIYNKLNKKFCEITQ